MAVEQTLSIVKPDAVAKNAIGEIYARFEKAGLAIAAAKMLQLDNELAGGFYARRVSKMAAKISQEAIKRMFT